MADYALELSFDAASDAAVGDAWSALQAAAVPSQADNARGMVNAPHLSLVVAAHLDRAVAEQAAQRVGAMLPVVLRGQGSVVFGRGARVTVAWLVEPPAALTRAVMELREIAPAVRHPVWTPHITLGRRIPRDRVGDALTAAGPGPDEIVATRLRWWDPTSGIETLTAV